MVAGRRTSIRPIIGESLDHCTFVFQNVSQLFFLYPARSIVIPLKGVAVLGFQVRAHTGHTFDR